MIKMKTGKGLKIKSLFRFFVLDRKIITTRISKASLGFAAHGCGEDDWMVSIFFMIQGNVGSALCLSYHCFSDSDNRKNFFVTHFEYLT